MNGICGEQTYTCLGLATWLVFGTLEQGKGGGSLTVFLFLCFATRFA